MIERETFNKSGPEQTTLTNSDKFAEGLQELQNISFSPLPWIQKLQDIEFSGNMPEATLYMVSFARGAHDVLSALKKRNMIPSNFVVPKIKLRYPEENDYFEVRCDIWQQTDAEGNWNIIKQQLTVNPDFLEEMSNIPPDEIGMFMPKSGIENLISMIGRIEDLAYLDGVEEAAHSVYKWNHPEPPVTNGKSAMESETAEYDSKPVEYHGLGWRIRLMMDRTDLPENLKEFILWPLRVRMHEAIDYRNTHRTEFGLVP